MVTEKTEEEKKPELVEKRIKPSVIRRRRAVKVKPPEAVPPLEKAPAAVELEAAPATAAAKVSTKKTPKKKTSKKEVLKEEALSAEELEAAKAPVKKAGKKTAKKAVEAPPESKPAKAAARGEKAPETPAARPAKATTAPVPAKEHAEKDVKVFAKPRTPAPPKNFFTPGGGRRKRGKRFQKPRQRFGKPVINSTRQLLKTEITEPKGAKRVLRIAEAISVADLSQRLGVKAGELIKKLMAMGVMATVNQFIDIDAATLIAQEYQYEVENVTISEDGLIDLPAAEGTSIEPRAPVVTVMGHVDHGKTSLLDAIRETNVATGEAGGITQHIGAYHVHLPKGDVTFLDTPGHEAFTSMRARGAKATDIVVLVVAADDGVMPQTVEAINHARAAEVPIIVAVNKIDLPQAEPDRIKTELSGRGLVAEEWGGDTIFIEVSAKQRTNIKELLDMILLQAEILELKAPVDGPANGVIIEAKLDKGRGPVATVLIQSGRLRTGDAFVAGFHSGRVRAMLDDTGKRVKEAGPSSAIEILGLSGVPMAGDAFSVVKDEITAKQITSIRERKNLEKAQQGSAKVSLEDLYEKITMGEVQELNIILKADVQGSIEAVKESLEKLSTDAVQLKILHNAVGGINEGDVMLAAASRAIIIGFNVRPETKARELAIEQNVDVKLYNVIYHLVDEIKSAMEGLLKPIISEEIIGTAEVREVFRVSKVGNVAGCYLTSGKATRASKAHLIRDNVVIYNGKLGTLRRFKDDVKEVQSGYECGMTIEGYNDIKVGDVIELYVEKEEAAKL
ncbi:MAG: translation initiation factor IF-2 [Thermodesulfobacteriota bacterium]